MVMKKRGRKIYKTMQGKQIDMDMLRKRNELTPAVGNARVNARGDELGPGGKIVRKREDIIKEYYTSNPHAVVNQDPVRRNNDAAQETVTQMNKISASNPTTRAQSAVEDSEEEWVEDDDGNFVLKEE
jgi:hypothetical protein